MKFLYPEGATPLDDISGLKVSWVKRQSDLNDVEVENVLKAVDKYLRKNIGMPSRWFNVSFLQKIHYEMFCDVWEWAGKFRTTQTCPGIKAYQIPTALEHLCQDVMFWTEGGCDLTILEQSVRIHHRLVYIHPYPNGNGRFSRLVSDCFLKSLGAPIPKWPIDLDREGNQRKSYIRALKEADAGDFESLMIYVSELC